ncbi:unnamed protein product [Closterium sp. Yama58-4]|nr:unnamed protein product [Closterium sp. Yama58-4]
MFLMRGARGPTHVAMAKQYCVVLPSIRPDSLDPSYLLLGMPPLLSPLNPPTRHTPPPSSHPLPLFPRTLLPSYSCIVEHLASSLPAGTIRLNSRCHRFIGPLLLLSLGVLKERAAGKDADSLPERNLFCPPLPETKLGAIRRLGFGVADKVFLEFPEPAVFGEDTAELEIVWDVLEQPLTPPTHWPGPWWDSDAAQADSSADANAAGNAADALARFPAWTRKLFSFHPVNAQSRVVLAWIAGKEAYDMESWDGEERTGESQCERENGASTCNGGKAANGWTAQADSAEGAAGAAAGDEGVSAHLTTTATTSPTPPHFNRTLCNVIRHFLPKETASRLPEAVAGLRTQWGSNPLFRGSYSFVPPGGSGEDLNIMALPAPEPEDFNLASLAHLPAFTTLALFDETWLKLEGDGSHPFPFDQLPSLKSVEFDANSPRFELMFPSGVSCSRLERLLLNDSDNLDRLPDDIGERLPRLRYLSIRRCENLSELPEQFASLSCLRELTISSCNMVKLPENFGELPAVKVLTLNFLPISTLPDSFYQLTSLETLNLSYCNALFALPDRFGFLTALNSLCILNTPYMKLPDDIGALTNLHTLRLAENFPQQLLPSSFTQLSSLTRLDLIQCMITELPEDLGKLSNLRELTIQSCSKIETLPDSLTDLVNLNVLKAVDCDSLASIPTTLSNLARLKELALAKLPQVAQLSKSLPCSLEILSIGSFLRLTPLLEIPSLPRLRKLSLTSVGLMRGLAAGVMMLSCLEELELRLIGEAEELPLPLEVLSNLRSLTIHSTGRMKKLPEGLGSALRQLRRLEIHRAVDLTDLTDSFTELQSLTSVEIHAPKLPSLPDGIGALSRLRQLNLENCSSLTELPASLTQLSCLHEVNLRFTPIRFLPCQFGQVSRLKELSLDGCKQLTSLPVDFTQLKMLQKLSFSECGENEIEAPGVANMYGLQLDPSPL